MSAIALACALGPPAANVDAANILLVSNNNTTSQSLFDFLVGEGHTVTREARRDGPGNANDFDVVIVARETNSGDYDEGTEPQDWNAVTAPMICMAPHLMRNNRWGWIDGTSLPGLGDITGYDDPFVDPAHPFVAGQTTDILDPAHVATGAASALPENAKVIATLNSGGSHGIFVIPSGTTMFNDRGMAGDVRIGFIRGNEGSWDNINANGEQILRNMILNLTVPPVDTDGDGMWDGWEDRYDNTDKNVPDASIDPDQDGLTNGDEFSEGTNPDLADTDGDDVNDGDEVSGALNTFFPAPTDPKNADSDGDGATDGEEIHGTLNTSYGNAPTNPNAADTDFDTMDDYYEMMNNLIAPGLNPNDFSDGLTDLDGDTIWNQDEYYWNTDVDPTSTRTRADMPDTDEDGYGDEVEDNFGIWTSTSLTGSNPANPDTDGDGLLDGEENQDLGSYQGAGVTPAWCDPNLADTDTDGLTDGDEVLTHGTDPQNADTDGDTFEDFAEINVFHTDPTDRGSVPLPGQLKELRVNFAQTGEGIPAGNGFGNYEADHEVPETFTAQAFPAFDTTITVTPSWAEGASPAAMQMLDRGGNDGSPWPAFYRHFIGTDNRQTPTGDPLTLTITGLPAGLYKWTSYHHDPQDQTGPFTAELTDANGTSTAEGNVSSGNDDEDPFVLEMPLKSDGSTPVTLAFSNPGDPPTRQQFFVMNGFMITNTDLLPPSTTIGWDGSDLVIGWDYGNLYEADSPTGPWTKIEGAVAPSHMVTPSEAQKYYRAASQ